MRCHPRLLACVAMMEELGHRLSVLDASLEKFKAESNPSWQAAEIFNTLLTLVKEQYRDDPVIQAISPAEKGVTVPGALGQDISKMDAGTMRAAIGQMQSLTGLGIGIG